MLNHFANEVIRSLEFQDFANKQLQAQDDPTLKSSYALPPLDVLFLKSVEERQKDSKGYMGPLFRYGAQAELNSVFRLQSHGLHEYAVNNPNPTLKMINRYSSSMEGSTGLAFQPSGFWDLRDQISLHRAPYFQKGRHRILKTTAGMIRVV